jgi:hypothetical protein
MLRSVRKCQGYALAARDGRIGHVREFYFDDSTWTLRYLVAQAGNWLTGRLVLLSPFALGRFHPDEKMISVELTREQIRNCPSPETDMPVSRQFEADYHRYFGWPYYWAGPYLWGPSPYPVLPPEAVDPALAILRPAHKGNPHLRSTEEVTGYHIGARDGEIGHVHDFLFNDGDWSIRYVDVETRNWIPGKHVLVPPGWIKDIEWEDSLVRVEADREDIRNAPGYDPAHPISGDLEKSLAQYFEIGERKV